MNSSLVVVSSSPWHQSDLHFLHLLGAIMTCFGSICSLYLIASLVRIEYLGKSFRLFLFIATLLLIANSQINLLIHWLADSDVDDQVQNVTVMGCDLRLTSYQLRVAHFSSMSVLLLERVLATLLIEYYSTRFNWGLRFVLVFIGISLYTIIEGIRVLFQSLDASTRIMLGLGMGFSIIGLLVIVFLNECHSRMHLYNTISIKATVKLISVLSFLLPALIISSSHLRHGFTDLPCIGPCIVYVLSKDVDEEKRRRIQMSRYSTSG